MEFANYHDELSNGKIQNKRRNYQSVSKVTPRKDINDKTNNKTSLNFPFVNNINDAKHYSTLKSITKSSKFHKNDSNETLNN